jgi:hypothetical protein
MTRWGNLYVWGIAGAVAMLVALVASLALDLGLTRGALEGTRAVLLLFAVAFLGLAIGVYVRRGSR